MYEDAYDLLNPNKYPPLNHPIDVDEESVQTSYETFTQREIKKTDKKQNHQLGRALTLGLPRVDQRMRDPKEADARWVVLSECHSWDKRKKKSKRAGCQYLMIQTFPSLIEQNSHLPELSNNIKNLQTNEELRYKFHSNTKLRQLLGGRVAPIVKKEVIKIFDALTMVTMKIFREGMAVDFLTFKVAIFSV
ncbi:Oidioi.mRNA.OKI2018_I69.PAR.g13231.t1.cds [Oikopleura dioica]|uniref:Oidioi.mRNA.OKI2018_I69.PAR.g13231.t1.cds n=1 Tax=Oikopleura dioica TaxID=34765 RepID=A0ABN7S717_OIKDI|nr:Oidioi.mRNA.OKI2018_I69.PAR.g13231.t1.cds [Oikopleura dioica]